MAALTRFARISALLVGLWVATAAAAPAPWRFAPEKDYGPFVFADERGQLAGLSVDLLQRMAQRQGWQIQPLAAAPLKQQLDLLRSGEADLISSLRPTPERSGYLAFSVPYVSVPAIVVVRQEKAQTGRLVANPLADFSGRRVAVGAGYAVEAFLRSAHPEVAWQAVADDVEALRGVQDKRFDAAVVDAASAAFVKRQHRLQGLASRGPVGFEYTLSFAVPRDRQDLLEQLDAAILALPAADRQAIVDRWMKPLADDPLWVRGWGLGLAAGSLLLLAALAAGLLWRQAAARRTATPPGPPAAPR